MAQLYEINLRDYWNVFLKRRSVIAVSFSVVFIGVFIYTNIQVPVYTAYVLLKADPSLSMPSEVVFPSTYRYAPGAENVLSDYTRQIVSFPVLQQAAEELGLIKSGMTEKEKNLIVSGISATVSATEIEKTNMIRLQVSSKDPNMAADLANKTALAFKRTNAEQKNTRARNVRVFIEKTLKNLARKLKVQNNRLRELTMKGALGTGVNIVNQIYDLEQKRMELLSKFTEYHPDVGRLNEQIGELKEKLKVLPKEEFEYGILKRDIGINETLYTSLKQKLPEAQIKEAEKVDNIFIINPAVPPRSPSYPQKGKNYVMGVVLGLILGISAALVIEHIDTSIGRVEDIENFIKVGVLGVIPFCARRETEESDAGKRGKWERRLRFAPAFFKDIFFKKNVKRPAITCDASVLALDHDHGSLFLEAFRILSVNLQVMFGKGERIKNKMLLITSCNPEEGKSVVTSNLGVIMAQLGYKTLIVDADSRRANIHRIFGLKQKEGGLLDILMDKISPEAATRTVTDIMLGSADAGKIMDKPWLNNLRIVTAGTIFPNPVNLFNSQKMDDLLNYFKAKYDVVLLDTSPVLAVSDPTILIPKMDGVILVYKAGVTSRLALRRAKIQIENVKGSGGLSGVILNNVTPEVGVDTYYYYNRRYYGHEEVSPPKRA
jgi:capsular exopolysaccharide synthesis family protein